MGLCQTRHKIPLVTLAWQHHILMTPPADASWVAGAASTMIRSWFQKSWAKYGNWESPGSLAGGKRKCCGIVVMLPGRHLCKCDDITEYLWEENWNITAEILCDPGHSGQEGERGHSIQLARPSNEQCWYSQNQPGESSRDEPQHFPDKISQNGRLQ